MAHTLEISTKRNIRVRTIVLALFLLVASFKLQAQTDSIRPNPKSFPRKPLTTSSTLLHIDTTRKVLPLSTTTTTSDAIFPNASTQIKTRPHNPRSAIILSAVLPGAGQVYNHQAWKIPIVYAGLGAVSYIVFDNYRQMKMFKDEYLYRVKHNGTPLLDKYSNYPTANILNLYQSKNKDFQLYVFVDLAVYALNIVDAFVFAHLYDFEINDNLSFHVEPIILPYNLAFRNTTGASFSLSWHF